MGRWEPDARGRLEQAALELYAERGYERTTVAEIAERAGLTERTFYRHFTDKREVLFSGSNAVTELMIATALDAPRSAPPIEAVGAALQAIGAVIEQRGNLVQRRQSVIAANTELQERELIKMASWVAALTGALEQRGVSGPAATLTAEAGIAAFRVAFTQWIRQPDRSDLPGTIADTLEQLRAVTSGS